MKPLTLEETRLKEEMKSRCLAKGQYVDENAKKKFDMLCHLEDFEVQYWELQQENQKYKEVIDKAIEYINKYAWQEDIIGGIYTTTGKPVIDRYMQLEWDNCNELLDILKEVSVRKEQ